MQSTLFFTVCVTTPFRAAIIRTGDVIPKWLHLAVGKSGRALRPVAAFPAAQGRCVQAEHCVCFPSSSRFVSKRLGQPVFLESSLFNPSKAPLPRHPPPLAILEQAASARHPATTANRLIS